MTNIPANKMAGALRGFSDLLLKMEILEVQGFASIQKAATSVGSRGSEDVWSYTIPKSEPILFSPTILKSDTIVRPRLLVDIQTCVVADGLSCPFEQLNTTIEICDSDNSASRGPRRWHIDLANRDQEGPRTHLQDGGHWIGLSGREVEGQLDVPRHQSPPLDLILAAETIVANFYREEWSELRKSDTWNFFISQSQKLCYTAYYNQFGDALNSDRHSILDRLWVDSWTT